MESSLSLLAMSLLVFFFGGLSLLALALVSAVKRAGCLRSNPRVALVEIGAWNGLAASTVLLSWVLLELPERVSLCELCSI
jgi:hypothetical protein